MIYHIRVVVYSMCNPAINPEVEYSKTHMSVIIIVRDNKIDIL